MVSVYTASTVGKLLVDAAPSVPWLQNNLLIVLFLVVVYLFRLL